MEKSIGHVKSYSLEKSFVEAIIIVDMDGQAEIQRVLTESCSVKLHLDYVTVSNTDDGTADVLREIKSKIKVAGKPNMWMLWNLRMFISRYAVSYFSFIMMFLFSMCKIIYIKVVFLVIFKPHFIYWKMINKICLPFCHLL